jgi:N-acetyl-anhydromuramyl-L-alanine amidase AmpD
MNIITPVYKWNGRLEQRTSTKFIVIHHAAALRATVEDIHSWHLANGWSGIGYNYVIRKDGTVYQGRPIDAIGAHTKGYNEVSIGICLEGNLDQEHPTQAQMLSLNELVDMLQAKYPETRIMGHRAVNDTSCPGRNFTDKMILDLLSIPKAQPVVVDTHADCKTKIADLKTENVRLTVENKRLRRQILKG